MRIRALKPGFFKNEELAELSPWHRLCYEGLWCCADREGRMQDRPKRLKADIFPYDDLDMNVLLWDLMAAGFIVRYAVNSHPFICIPTWEDHQHPRQDEAPSTFPAFEAGTERVRTQTVHVTGDTATVTDPLLRSHVVASAPRMGQVDLGSGTSGNGNLELGDGNLEAGQLRKPAQAQAAWRDEDLVELWNSTMKPPIPSCRELNDERRRKIRARRAKRPSFAEWREGFAYIARTPFFQGSNDRGWVADFDWAIKNDTTIAKILDRARTGAVGPAVSAQGHQNAEVMARVAARYQDRDEPGRG